MALTATDTADITKPINSVYMRVFLERGIPLIPYFAGSKPGVLDKKAGTATVTWRQINAVTPTITSLTEITTASYMQGRTPAVAAETNQTATVSKYGQFIILTEELELFNFDPTVTEIFNALGESAARSLNQLQRDEIEENSTQQFASNDASDGAVDSAILAADIHEAVNVLARNNARPFTPMSTGSRAIGTVPMLPAYWGITHPDVAYDISQLTGFNGVETYAGQVETAAGEFGAFKSAGMAIRFIATSDASIDVDTGAAVGSTGLRSNSANVDLYTTVVLGQGAHGSVGFGQQHPDGIFRADDFRNMNIELIFKDRRTGGTSDPLEEISTLAWKSYHAAKVLNTSFSRAIRSGATNL